MSRFWTSDTHFGHKNIISYCNRPFKSVDEMDAEMIWRWNKTVKPEDEVFHLGDFAFAPRTRVEDLLSKLNGRKVLIAGNHDPKGTRNAQGWDRTTYYEFATVGDHQCLMTHIPHDAVAYKASTDALPIGSANRCAFDVVLHGHQHGLGSSLHEFKQVLDLKYIDCGVDAGWSFTPISEAQLINRLKELSC